MEECCAELTRLAFHPGHVESEGSDGPQSVWTAEVDRALAVSVRTYQFDFELAARELSSVVQCDKESCRRRWAELDMTACTELSERLERSASLTMPLPVTPSGFNIFEDSLGAEVSSIFSGVRAALPTMSLSDEDDSSDDEPATGSTRVGSEPSREGAAIGGQAR